MATRRWQDGKDPSDVWDYSLDATQWMAEIGDTLASVTVTVAPSGLTVGATSYTAAGIATVRLSGGAAGTDYGVTFTLGTTGGRTLERTVRLLVGEL